MGAGAARSNFTAEARFGVEWLLRMWDDPTRTLYYQVGIGAGNATTVGDHDIWRLPQADDSYGGSDPADRYIRHRPVFRAAPPGAPVSPNLAGRDAAAFALCFQVFEQTLPQLAASLPARRRAHLRSRRHRTRRAPADGDSVRLLSGERMARRPRARRDASSRSRSPRRGSFRRACRTRRLATTSNRPPSWAQRLHRALRRAGDPLNLYDVSGLAHYELVRALRQAGDPSGLAVSEAQLIGNLARAAATRRCSSRQRDPFGFGFPWATADTASHGDGLSVMASEYESLTGDASYRADGARWLANVLGANAWGSSFIIGDGTMFPDCPQHQVANLAGSLDGSLDGSPPVLAGAVVEGPSDEASTGTISGHAALPGPRRRHVRALRQRCRVPRQRALLHDRRAGDRPDRLLDARLLLAGHARSVARRLSEPSTAAALAICSAGGVSATRRCPSPPAPR